MRKGIIAVLLFLCFAAFLVSDGLFSSRAGICIEPLYSIQPWENSERDSSAAFNPALDHQALVVLPWMQHTWNAIRQGRIPLWTHLAGGGTPFMGNMSCACFYPLNWLGLVVPFDLFWSLAGGLKLLAGAVFAYMLLRTYGLRFLSCLVGAIAFGFSGFQVCWMNHPHSNVALFLPALFLAVEFYLKRRTGVTIVFNAVLLGLQFLGGSPETSFVLFLSWALYLLYRIRQEAEFFGSEGLSLLFYGALAGLLGAALASFQLLPFFEYLRHSYGLEMRIGNWSEFLNGGAGRLLTFFGVFMGLLFPVFVGASIGLLQRKNTIFIGVWSGLLGGLCLIVALRIGFWLGAKPHLLMQVFPELYGAANGGCRTVGDISYSALNGGYVGVITAFLALYTFVAPCKRRPLQFFIFLFIFSFGAVHSIPWLVHILKAVPFLGWIHNSSLLCVTAFSIAVIAPFGLEDLLFRAANIRGKSAAVCGVVVASLVVLWAVIVSGWTFFETGKELMGEDSPAEAKILISSPVKGTIQNGLDEFVIRGRAARDVEHVRATLDNLFAGDVRTVDASGLETESGRAAAVQEGTDQPSASLDRATLEKYPKSFELSYPLDTLDEGTYKLRVMPSKSGGANQGDSEAVYGDWVDVRLVREKTVTRKDLLVFCLSVAVFLFLLSRTFPPAFRAALVIVVLGLDLCCFGLGYNKTSATEDIYPPTDVTDFFASREKPFRIFAEGGILQPNTNFPYGIEHMEWDDRLGIDGYWKVCNHIKRDHLAKPRELNVLNFNLEHPLFDFMGIKYVLVKNEFDLTKIEKFKLVFDGKVRIYENTNARKRAFIVGDWINLQDHPIEDVLRSDLRNKPVLHNEPPIAKGGKGSVDIQVYESEYVRLSAKNEGPVLLVLTDNHFPGWKAFVDGEEVQILKTTACFRAVPLAKEGLHEVEFRYSPSSFYGGIYIALSSLLLCLAFIVVPGLTRLMQKRETPA